MASAEPPPAYSSRHDHQLLLTFPTIKQAGISTTDAIQLDSIHLIPPPDYTLNIDSPHSALRSDISINPPTTFHIKQHLIYISKPALNGTKSTPHYQLHVEKTRTGKPKSLKIRRLLSSEIQKLTTNPCTPLPFDDDTLLYFAQPRPSYFASRKAGILEIRGRQAGTLKGLVEVSPPKREQRLVWHVTRNSAGDYLKEENRARMERKGYRPEEEERREVLFQLGRREINGKREWRDGANGDVLAVEFDGKEGTTGTLEILEGELKRRVRDALVFCWCCGH